MEKILITEPEYKKAQHIFDEASEFFSIEVSPHDEHILAEKVTNNNCRALIVGVEKYTKELYDSFPANGGIIARFGVGSDSLNKALCKEKNIIVTNTPGALDDSVAELCIWLIGDMARMITYQNNRVKHDHYRPGPGILIKNKNLGLIGFGAIAKKVAKIAKLGFSMNVHAFDIMTEQDIKVKYNMSLAEYKKSFYIDTYSNRIEEILPKCDFVSSHLPLIEETQGFFNSEIFKLFKKNAYFINTSRGGVVNEEDLDIFLGDEKIKGAALDVLSSEPYICLKKKQDLRTWNRVTLTPHIGSNTKEANKNMAEMALENIKNYFAGEFDRLNAVD